MPVSRWGYFIGIFGITVIGQYLWEAIKSKKMLEITDMAFTPDWASVEIILSDGTEAVLPAWEICEGQTPNEFGEYFLTLPARNPTRCVSYAGEQYLSWEDEMIKKGAYDALYEFDEQDLLKIAIQYAGEAANKFWMVTGKRNLYRALQVEKVHAINFTHLSYLLQDWELVEGVELEQSIIAA